MARQGMELAKEFMSPAIVSFTLPFSLCPDYLRDAVSDFSEACVSMWDEIQHVLQHHEDISQDENTVRILNNKLMNVERAFIHPEGLPGRSYFK